MLHVSLPHLQFKFPFSRVLCKTLTQSWAMMCSNTLSINHKISSLPDCVVKFSVNTTFVANATVSGGKLLSFGHKLIGLSSWESFWQHISVKKHVERTGFCSQLMQTAVDASCSISKFYAFLMMLCNLFD